MRIQSTMKLSFDLGVQRTTSEHTPHTVGVTSPTFGAKWPSENRETFWNQRMTQRPPKGQNSAVQNNIRQYPTSSTYINIIWLMFIRFICYNSPMVLWPYFGSFHLLLWVHDGSYFFRIYLVILLVGILDFDPCQGINYSIAKPSVCHHPRP